MLRALYFIALVTGCLSQTNIFNSVCKSIIANLDCTTGYEEKNLCGTDGIIYKTECHFAVAHCHSVNLDVDENNGCVAKMTTKMPTTSIPVKASTVAPLVSTLKPITTTPPSLVTRPPTKSTHPATKPTFSGACGVLVMLTCSDSLDQICGTDLQTYDNPCKFEVAKCYNPKLAMKSKGECKPTAVDVICKTIHGKDCPPENEPFCGSDGNSYANLCELEKAKCTTPGLRVSGLGHC